MDDKKLIEIAKSEKTKFFDKKNAIELFLYEHEVKPSESRVPTMDLYWIFMKWYKQRGKKKREMPTYKKFFKELKKHYTSHKGCGRNYYKISGKDLILSQEEKAEVQKFIFGINYKARKRREKKARQKSSKESGTK